MEAGERPIADAFQIIAEFKFSCRNAIECMLLD